MTDLGCLLSPGSIAIVGASADSAGIRGRILEYLLQRKYSGRLYLVSSTQSEMRGHRTYPSLAAIEGEVDLVLIAVRADATYAVLEDCVAIGAKYAICFSSGFAESGADGARLQVRIAQLADGGTIRICGPNTAGFFNAKRGVPATFARNVDLRRSPIPSFRRGPCTVAIVAQSGGLGFALSDRCVAEHGLIINQVISTGNEVDLEVLDFVEYAIGEEHTRVILLLIESLKHPGRLSGIARRSRAARKPIIVSKFGKTGAGSRAVKSHAGRLTGLDETYTAVFRRLGLIRVDNEESMTDLAAAFSLYPLPAGRRVGILTTSGGAGVWMADACESVGLLVPVLDAATQSTLAAYVPAYGAIQNPVDLTAQVTVNPSVNAVGPSPLVGALAAVHDSPSIDCVVLIANMSDGEALARERDGLAQLVKHLKKPLILYSHAPPSEKSREQIQNLGLACITSTRRVAETLLHMVSYAEFLAEPDLDKPSPTAPLTEADRALLAHGLSEYAAKLLLARNRVTITREELVHSSGAAVEAASRIAARVALKIQSHQIPHKTEMGGVILGLDSESSVRAAYDTLMDRARLRAPTAVIEGVLVQEMRSPGHELALGVVRDPDFGPMMMVGMGGIYVEIFKDVVVEPLPVNRHRALSMLKRLKTWPILGGARATAVADIDAMVDLMEKLSSLVLASGDACREIDLNPVFVYDQGLGVVVVDALVIGREEAAAEAERGI